MQFKQYAVALLSAAVAVAEPNKLERRQATIPAALSSYYSEVGALATAYLLNPSASAVFLSAVSAASITDLAGLYTATEYPSAIATRLPTAYTEGFNSFLSLASSLRVSALSAAGLLTTASSNSTTTGAAGNGTASTSTSGVVTTTITSSSIITSLSTGVSTTATVVTTELTTITTATSAGKAVQTAMINGAAGLIGLLGVAFAL